ncbi:MAG: hypothetical protein SNJ67_07685 [Chloracidobacterium sp.]|uniref:Uncharacterized protein n=1 Tax=Chloracidobacterium validum TaxID=2821543 RepID=A0ABX8B724_9BACT|nr:hypothetical protein [Chloracidobacterium validum]QUW01851.1 hypothetical protein J8C06_05570 [Chloracidobacterium validum]
MKETSTKPTSPSSTDVPAVNASLETFRTLSLPEKALTIAQTQAMLFSNTVVRTLATLLRGNRPDAT